MRHSCSTISHLMEKYQDMLEFSNQSRVVFYYYCSHESQGESKPTYDNIIRALIRQFATRVDFSADPLVRSLWEKSKYEEIKLRIKEWEHLLKELIRGSNGTALVIDALDECEEVDVQALLKFFKELEAMSSSFRLIHSFREHVQANIYFKPKNLSIIEMTSEASMHEIDIFIKEQIAMEEDLEQNPEFENSIMCESNIGGSTTSTQNTKYLANMCGQILITNLPRDS